MMKRKGRMVPNMGKKGASEGDLPRAVAIGGNPNQSAGRPEVCEITSLSAHLRPRIIH